MLDFEVSDAVVGGEMGVAAEKKMLRIKMIAGL